MTALLSSHEAEARLSGDASLTYTSYEGQSASSHVSSNSLVQNYSLLYSSEGPLYNSRVGSYDISLGYNWTAFDTKFKSSGQPNDNYNETRGHLMYNGEIKLDPKEVPFKLNAYSRDMTRNGLTQSPTSGLESIGTMVGNRDQVTGINDGLHIQSGATLIAGVKNGMTNGYNEILRHFPMILFDYKDVINRDLRSQNPVDDRLSRLAFVSLNKKDNWLHYRHTLFEDYIDSKNNYVENEVQLGTVDQNLTRRWIDFSNWLKVSTDLQLSKRKSNYQESSLEEINLNLFVGAERQYWNARTFTTFNRSLDENQKLSYQTTLPLYASGVLSQDLSWDARTSFRNIHDKDMVGVSSRFTNVLAGYRVSAFKRALFSLVQNSEVEVSESNTSKLVTLSGGVETTSSPRFSRTVSLGGSYNIKNSITSSDVMSSSNFIEQKLVLHVAYAPTNTLRFDVSQSNIFTNGNYTQFNSTTSNSATLLSQYVNPRNLTSAETGSNSYHSLSRLMASWNPMPRLDTSLTLNEDIYKSSAQKLSKVTDVQSNVSYSNDVWSVGDTFGYSRGDKYVMDDNASTISNTASLRYIHSRSLDASASVAYSETQSAGAISRGTEVIQRLNYYHFTNTGVMRKLYEFNQTFTYSDGLTNTTTASGKTLLIGLKYYPISQLTLAAGAGYTYTTSLNDYTLIWNTAAVANFRLLQVSLDYIHGFRKTDGVKENKFTGNIRKSF